MTVPAAPDMANVPGNHPAIVSFIVFPMPENHDPGMKLLRPERLPMPPTPPEPPAAYATPPVPSIPDTTPAIWTVMGRVIAMCIRSARKDTNTERNEERDTLLVSIICSHADFQPESMPE